MAEPVEWELVCSNGTCIKLRDIHFEGEMVEVADGTNLGWITRLPSGPVRITAIVEGTEPQSIAEERS